MRNALASEITDLAAADQRIVLLSGDIGNQMFDRYKSKFPDRFLNCGVAEANMMSVAAGMALCGLRPVTYTIASFSTTRCLEQIRVDVCCHNAPVVIVGVGAGLSYASLNPTHHSCEDIAFLRMLPNITILCPGDPTEVRLALRAALKHEGPVYIRLGKKGEPIVHTGTPNFVIGKGITVREGTDVCLIGTGNVLSLAVEAADELSRKGCSAQVISFHTVKPLDQDLLSKVFSRFGLVVTIEEHNLNGGLGGSIAEWLADQAIPKARLCRIGTADWFLLQAGEQEYARERYGLTPEAIAEKVWKTLSRSSSGDALP